MRSSGAVDVNVGNEYAVRLRCRDSRESRGREEAERVRELIEKG